MKSLSVLLVVFSLNLGIGLAQKVREPDPLDRLMVKKILTCKDILINCGELIPRFYHQGKSDSLEMIVDYWQRHCGLTEPLFRFKILYAIERQTFSEMDFKKDVWKYLLRYKEHIAIKERNPAERLPIFERILRYYLYDDYLADEFDGLTLLLAEENRLKTKPGTAEHVLSTFYANQFDQAIRMLKTDNRFRYTRLKRFYDQEVHETRFAPERHFAVFSGMWLPQGKNRLLGNHPTIGLMLGIKRLKTLVDFSVAVRFLASKNEYLVKYQGEVLQTDHYLGYYFGIDLGYELWRNLRHEWDLIGGVALDGFDQVQTNTSDDEKGKTLATLNLNLGVGYRFYFEEYSAKYLGFEARFNFASYNNKGGTDLSGNSISLRIVYAWSGNEQKYKKLKDLLYRYE